MRLEIPMDNSSGVAEIDAIDELVQDKFDLSLSYCSFVGTQIFFEIMLGVLKNKMELFLERKVYDVF